MRSSHSKNKPKNDEQIRAHLKRIGALYRRLRARLGSVQAAVDTAHAIARAVYKSLKYKLALSKVEGWSTTC